MRTAPVILLLAAALVRIGAAAAEGIRLEQTGVRIGFPATGIDHDFLQYEAHALIDTPCHRDLGRDWTIRSGVELSAGVLERNGERGFIGGIGPEFTLGRERLPIEIFCGGNLTVLSRDQYGATDFGFPLQFTSHLGVGFRVTRHWTTSYRLQHMSNASLRPSNPGLNLHVIGVQYRF